MVYIFAGIIANFKAVAPDEFGPNAPISDAMYQLYCELDALEPDNNEYSDNKTEASPEADLRLKSEQATAKKFQAMVTFSEHSVNIQ